LPSINEEVVSAFLEQVGVEDALGPTVAGELATAFAAAKLPKADDLLQLLTRLTGEAQA
jgi:hypothetical protein